MSAFVNNVHDNIRKQSLILPPGAVGTRIGGEAITQQTASGVVFVAASTSPVLVRDNFDNARIWGSFFLNGATARGWVAPGPDGILGSADDVLSATGETLAQIQDRVLGTASRAPLYTRVAGYTTVGIRGGARLGRHEVLVDAENLTDENYRGISWGMDAPGVGVNARYVLRF